MTFHNGVIKRVNQLRHTSGPTSEENILEIATAPCFENTILYVARKGYNFRDLTSVMRTGTCIFNYICSQKKVQFQRDDFKDGDSDLACHDACICLSLACTVQSDQRYLTPGRFQSAVSAAPSDCPTSCQGSSCCRHCSDV